MSKVFEPTIGRTLAPGQVLEYGDGKFRNTFPSFPFISARSAGFLPAATAEENSAALQAAIDRVEALGGGVVWLPSGEYDFSGGIELKQGVAVIGSGPFSAILNCTTAGVNGFQASSALSGVRLEDFQLNGTGVANASENGIDIVGDASGGFPKLVLRNLLVRSWGAIGAYLENCWDAAVENCNFSSNTTVGNHLVNCFSIGWHKNVCYNNGTKGLHAQSCAGALYTGTVQENGEEGARFETAQDCEIQLYAEQNGHSGSGITSAQVSLTQRSGGYAVSSGCELKLFALGGKGSTSPTMESGYGAYVDFAENNDVSGTYGGHLTADVIFTSNSSGNKRRTMKHLTGLAGGDSPVTVTNNGSNRLPVDYEFTNVPSSGTGNVGAGEDDLFTHSLVAGTLAVDKQSILIEASGTTAANANNKRWRLKFGATTLIDTGNIAVNGADWTITARVVRRGATVQYARAEFTYNGATQTYFDFTAPAETLSGAITIKVTGEATADNDIVQREMSVRGL